MKAVARPVVITSELRASADNKPPQVIEQCTTGKWSTPYHGTFELTEADLNEAVRNFDQGFYRVKQKGSLPAGLDHFTGPATYWIDSLFVEPNEDGSFSLMANVTWTALGIEKLERDEYRYTSMEYNHRGCPIENPERAGEFRSNVLTGSTLTNDPLFKEKLKGIKGSASSGNNNNEGDSMNLEELLKKKREDLTDDEQKFLAEHQDELTEDQRKDYGLDEAEPNDTPPADPEPGTNPEKPEGKKDPLSASAHMSATELAQLRADAAAGRAAQEELKLNRIKEGLQAHAREGKIRTDDIAKVAKTMASMSDEARKDMESVFSAMPSNPLLAKEQGSDGGSDDEVEVTNEDRLMASAFGNTPEEIEKFKKAEARK